MDVQRCFDLGRNGQMYVRVLRETLPADRANADFTAEEWEIQRYREAMQD